MKKITLLKSLLVAVMLTVGASAWAAVGDVTTNANIDFSNPITNGVVAGTVNSMTIGSGEIAKNGDAGWLSVYDATSTVTIPSAQRAGSKDVVNIQFKTAWGNKNNMGFGFNLKDAEGNALANFQYARWDGNAKNGNDLNIDMNGLVGAHNGNKPIAARYTLFDITVNYAARTITSVVYCNNTDGKGTTKTETFIQSLTNTNPIATFNIFGYGVGGNTDRASIFDDLIIKTTEGDYSVQTYDYTINWVCGATTVKSITRQGESGSSISLFDTDKTAFEVSGQKYFYVSDDSEGKTVTNDGLATVTITVREADTWSYTVSAVDESNNVLGVIGNGSVVEGESTYVNYSQYFLNTSNNKLLKADNSGTNSHWTKSFTPDKNEYVYNIVYKESGSVNGVVYFQEAEKLEGITILTGNNANIRCSNAAAGYAADDDITLTTLPAGIYKIGVQAFSPQSAGGSITISAGKDITFTSGNSNTTMHASQDILITENTEIVLKKGGGNRNGTDFIYIQKTGEVYESMSIVGDFSENAWEADKGIAMTRDAENPHIWTAVVKDFVVTSAKYSYEYKATANNTWGVYELGKDDDNTKNQEYNFDYDGAREGKYTLTFTVNTSTHKVSLAIEKQVTGQVYFVNTFDWDEANVKIWVWDANNSNYNYTGGSWPGVAMTKTSEQQDGHDVYTWSTYDITGTPTNLIISNNGSDTERTGDQPFVNGATYKADGSSTFTKAISAAGYATFCCNRAVDFSSTGLTAYIAKKDASNNVTFTAVTKVPANTGVLLKGDEGSYTINSTYSTELDDVTDNVLVGVTADTKVDAGSFVLMSGAEGVGFYKTTKEFTVGANTAYIEALPTAVRFISLDTEGEISTGIETLKKENNVLNNEYYNLSGQRVVKPTKGLYIVNGKKMVIK